MTILNIQIKWVITNSNKIILVIFAFPKPDQVMGLTSPPRKIKQAYLMCFFSGGGRVEGGEGSAEHVTGLH